MQIEYRSHIGPRNTDYCPIFILCHNTKMDKYGRYMRFLITCLDLDLTDDILSLLPFFVSGQHLLASHPAAIVETG